MTEKDRKKYPFATDILDIMDKYKDDDLLENLEMYVLDSLTYAADIFNKQLLLGEVSLFPPHEFDDWTDDEKLVLFDRWRVIDDMVALSKLGKIQKIMAKDTEEDLEEEDPNTNNGEGMVN